MKFEAWRVPASWAQQHLRQRVRVTGSGPTKGRAACDACVERSKTEGTASSAARNSSSELVLLPRPAHIPPPSSRPASCCTPAARLPAAHQPTGPQCLPTYSAASPSSSPSGGGGTGFGGSSLVSTDARSYSFATGGGGSGTNGAFLVPHPT
eukprot:189483-Chlamydomonas_euryale.AAC.3